MVVFPFVRRLMKRDAERIRKRQRAPLFPANRDRAPP
jgi:hypothetical protein